MALGFRINEGGDDMDDFMHGRRTITTSGVGENTTSAEYAEITIWQTTCGDDYGKTLDAAAVDLLAIRKAIAEAYGRQELINLYTTKFGIKYNSTKNHYTCKHKMKIRFDLEIGTEKFGKTIDNIAHCDSKPKFSIKFHKELTNFMREDTYKDYIISDLLFEAYFNAREKALALADDAGIHLGSVLRIDTGPFEIQKDMEHRTYEDVYATKLADKMFPGVNALELMPHRVLLRVAVTVTWAIEDNAAEGE
jgi:uncharacterized protein YggE